MGDYSVCVCLGWKVGSLSLPRTFFFFLSVTLRLQTGQGTCIWVHSGSWSRLGKPLKSPQYSMSLLGQVQGLSAKHTALIRKWGQEVLGQQVGQTVHAGSGAIFSPTGCLVLQRVVREEEETVFCFGVETLFLKIDVFIYKAELHRQRDRETFPSLVCSQMPSMAQAAPGWNQGSAIIFRSSSYGWRPACLDHLPLLF